MLALEQVADGLGVPVAVLHGRVGCGDDLTAVKLMGGRSGGSAGPTSSSGQRIVAACQ